jgi:hypothetical protein
MSEFNAHDFKYIQVYYLRNHLVISASVFLIVTEKEGLITMEEFHFLVIHFASYSLNLHTFTANCRSLISIQVQDLCGLMIVEKIPHANFESRNNVFKCDDTVGVLISLDQTVFVEKSAHL